VTGFVNQWTSNQVTPDFEPDNGYCDALIDIGFNECSSDQRNFWRQAMKANYRGDDGRRRIRMAAINLAERGGLHLRLSDIRCPVLWLHVCSLSLRPFSFIANPVQGTKDAVFSVANATEEIQLFTQSPDARLVPVDGGAHFLNCTHASEVNKALVDFVSKYK
jgi:pimeloyl-ACP methyl ester carboxylesterase